MSSDDQAAAQQRQFYRAPVSFSVTVETADGEKHPTEAHDLSGGGVRVSSESELQRGAPVTLHFRLPGSAREIALRGRVVLSYFEASAKVHQHGIAFTHIGGGDQEAIVHFIHEVQRRTLKGHLNK